MLLTMVIGEQLIRQIRLRASSFVSDCSGVIASALAKADTLGSGKRLNDSYFSKGIYNFWIDQADGRLMSSR